jgi:polysaccharide export outer membrane protein
MITKLLLAALLLASPALFGQSDFTIGVSDLLDVNVLGVADFTRELRVSDAGTVRMPFLGDVEVRGLTCRQAESKLAKLLNPNYVKDPQVSVSIKDPRSRMFSLMGAVIKPGQYQLQESMTLVSAIANAGGLDLGKAGDKATIQRSYKVGAGQVPSIEVDLKKLLMPGDMSLDVPIMPGDFINISQRDVNALAVYIIGDVNRPGPFDFSSEKGIKLSRALAIAGGPAKTAKLKGTALLRQKADGSVDRIAIDLGKVLKGQAPDLDLQPNDLVFVPSSVTKNLGWATLATLPTSIISRLILY